MGEFCARDYDPKFYCTCRYYRQIDIDLQIINLGLGSLAGKGLREARGTAMKRLIRQHPWITLVVCLEIVIVIGMVMH